MLHLQAWQGRLQAMGLTQRCSNASFYGFTGCSQSLWCPCCGPTSTAQSLRHTGRRFCTTGAVLTQPDHVLQQFSLLVVCSTGQHKTDGKRLWEGREGFSLQSPSGQGEVLSRRLLTSKSLMQEAGVARDAEAGPHQAAE